MAGGRGREFGRVGVVFEMVDAGSDLVGIDAGFETGDAGVEGICGGG